MTCLFLSVNVLAFVVVAVGASGGAGGNCENVVVTAGNVAGTDTDEQGIKRINIGRQYQPQSAGIVCGAECCQGNAGRRYR